jgi:hypothetical protein
MTAKWVVVTLGVSVTRVLRALRQWRTAAT